MKIFKCVLILFLMLHCCSFCFRVIGNCRELLLLFINNDLLLSVSQWWCYLVSLFILCLLVVCQTADLSYSMLVGILLSKEVPFELQRSVNCFITAVTALSNVDDHFSNMSLMQSLKF